MKRVFLSIFSILCFGLLAAQPIKFGVISDLHQDIIHDAPWRLSTFLEAAEKSGVDFIVDLGDFCFVKEENRALVEQWDAFKGDSYRAMGNHDMDNCTKEEYMAFTGMKARYYSFDRGDFHFIVLDPNNINDNGEYIPYANANFYVDSSKRAWIDPEQVAWLKSDIEATDKRCIILSHQSLESSVANRKDIQDILEAENSRVGYGKIVAALSGHDHTDYSKEIGGITYIQINSASDQWVGDEFACDSRYDKETYERRPALKYVVPYKDPLYAIVTLKKRSMKIKGVKSEFVAPSPVEMGYKQGEQPLTPNISDYFIKFK